MSGKGNRTKGADGEREIVRMLLDRGIDARKISRSGYATPDIEILDYFMGEVKRQEEQVPITVYKWLAQYDDVDMLFMRRNRMPWLVVMDLDVFGDLIARIRDENQVE